MPSGLAWPAQLRSYLKDETLPQFARSGHVEVSDHIVEVELGSGIPENGGALLIGVLVVGIATILTQQTDSANSVKPRIKSSERLLMQLGSSTKTWIQNRLSHLPWNQMVVF